MLEPIKEPQLVLCVPGPWSTRSELLEAIVRQSPGYIFGGRLLLDLETKHTCELVYEGADARIPGAFAATGPHWRATDAMFAIENHQSVVYLVGRGGSPANAEAMMRAGASLIRAGGLGVKVESTGLSHNPAAWLELCNDLPHLSAHRALVVYVTGDDVYSCGMHNLGLPDAIVSAKDSDEPSDLLKVFTRYVFTESPVIRPGQTFSSDRNAPIYRLLKDPGVRYEEGSLYPNPYGTWRLVLIARPDGAQTRQRH